MAYDKKGTLKMTVGKVALKDAGHSVGDMVEKVSDSIDRNKDKKFYPTLHLSTKDVPALKGYQFDDCCTLVVHARVKSHSQSQENESFSLDLEKIGVVAPAHDDEEDDDEDEEEEDN